MFKKIIFKDKMLFICIIKQRFSTCGTLEAHIGYTKKISLYKKFTVHIKYYLDFNNSIDNNCKYKI